jgi:hypothetical protein
VVQRRNRSPGFDGAGRRFHPDGIRQVHHEGSEPDSLAASGKTVKDRLDDARKKSAHRQRRIIYNNDGDDIWAKGADTIEKFLALRHTPLLDTHVDTIFYCTTQSFNLFTHDTRVAEVFLSREGSFTHNNLKMFLEQRTDGLRMSCDFARKHWKGSGRCG